MRLLFILFTILIGNISVANNITVSNIRLTTQNTTQNFTMIEFDLSWENSWRVSSGPSNWDAAWVFVKFRSHDVSAMGTSLVWQHASLNWVDGSGSGDGHTVPANSIIESANDNGAGTSYGVFIYRDADMVQGTVTYTDVQLRWNYGIDGLLDTNLVDVCVEAIEMVYVPSGSYYLGSGGTEVVSFYQYPSINALYQVTSESAITVGTVAGNLYYNTTGFAGDQSGPIPGVFPKGYDAFYCMKYEISQGQYADFISKTNSQLPIYIYTGALANRYNITAVGSGIYQSSSPDLACNYLSSRGLYAYLDWAALRPMSELEFVKACRGGVLPVPDEYPWGNASLATSPYTVVNLDLPNEEISVNYDISSGNANFVNALSNTTGPVRSGIFASNILNLGRVTSGSSYYGIMELGGNLLEQCISVGAPATRSFSGQLGDGVLDAAGNSNAVGWPSFSGPIANLGGSFVHSPVLMKVSEREGGAINEAAYGGNISFMGGRGVRQSP